MLCMFSMHAAYPVSLEDKTDVWCNRIKNALDILRKDIYVAMQREDAMRIDHLIGSTMEELCQSS
jgi:hypothetical protein